MVPKCAKVTSSSYLKHGLPYFKIIVQNHCTKSFAIDTETDKIHFTYPTANVITAKYITHDNQSLPL